MLLARLASTSTEVVRNKKYMSRIQSTRARTFRMSSNKLVFRTAVGSLMVQFFIGGVTVAGFLVPTQDYKRDDLRAILSLELASQVIEFVWYTVVVLRYAAIKTWTRYIDWFFSTPVMLASTTLFFQHRKEEPLDAILREWRFYVVLVFNWLMLAFGYALEREVIPMFAGLALGGIMFVASFTFLCTFADASDALSLGLFVAMYTVWGLYGVAAAFPTRPRTCRTTSSTSSRKIFYGVFLFIYALT